MTILTQEELKRLLYYNKYTGHFVRLVATCNRVTVGDLAGCKSANGSGGHYMRIHAGGKLWHSHQLAMLYEYGFIPKEIDHIDGNGCNNKLDNLRSVSSSGNKKNMPQLSSNTTGVTGVWFRKDTGKFAAEIINKGQKISLGCYDTLQDASKARKNGEIKYGFHKNHGRISPNNMRNK